MRSCFDLHRFLGLLGPKSHQSQPPLNQPCYAGGRSGARPIYTADPQCRPAPGGWAGYYASCLHFLCTAHLPAFSFLFPSLSIILQFSLVPYVGPTLTYLKTPPILEDMVEPTQLGSFTESSATHPPRTEHRISITQQYI
jgi:hypothetical protein